MPDENFEQNREQRIHKIPNSEKLGVAFVILYFVSIFIWVCAGFSCFKPALPAVTRLLTCFGLKQHWALFGPRTTIRNMHHLAKIRFSDGTIKLYEWPRVDQVNLLDKERVEPYSKLFTDNLPINSRRRLRVSVARFVTRANINPLNQPSLITLIDIVSLMPDPFLFYNNPKIAPRNVISSQFVYQVQPEDLK